MRSSYYYLLTFIFLTTGILLTYFGYDEGVSSSESGDSDDSGFIAMMVFGIIFIIVSIIVLGLGIRSHQENEKMIL